MKILREMVRSTVMGTDAIDNVMPYVEDKALAALMSEQKRGMCELMEEAKRGLTREEIAEAEGGKLGKTMLKASSKVNAMLRTSRACSSRATKWASSACKSASTKCKRSTTRCPLRQKNCSSSTTKTSALCANSCDHMVSGAAMPMSPSAVFNVFLTICARKRRAFVAPLSSLTMR